MRTAERICTPSEEEQSEEEDEDAVVESEEVECPLGRQAHQFHRGVAAPEQLHTQHGDHLLPRLLRQVARESGIDLRRLAMPQEIVQRMAMLVGQSSAVHRCLFRVLSLPVRPVRRRTVVQFWTGLRRFSRSCNWTRHAELLVASPISGRNTMRYKSDQTKINHILSIITNF